MIFLTNGKFFQRTFLFLLIGDALLYIKQLHYSSFVTEASASFLNTVANFRKIVCFVFGFGMALSERLKNHYERKQRKKNTETNQNCSGAGSHAPFLPRIARHMGKHWVN